MKFKYTAPVKWWLLTALSVTTFFSACKKNSQQEQAFKPEHQKFERLAIKVNPFSYANIQRAKQSLANKNSANGTSANIRDDNDQDRLYTYLKIDPNAVTGAILKDLEADSTIQILDFPFANGELYNDEFALDEAKAKQLADGSLYAVVKKNSPTEAILTSSSISTAILDVLYLPAEEDTTLQFQAFSEAGYTEEQIEQLRICLFKRPSGFVRYLDQQTGQLVNVPGMQVWGWFLAFPCILIPTGMGITGFHGGLSAALLWALRQKMTGSISSL